MKNYARVQRELEAVYHGTQPIDIIFTEGIWQFIASNTTGGSFNYYRPVHSLNLYE